MLVWQGNIIAQGGRLTYFILEDIFKPGGAGTDLSTASGLTYFILEDIFKYLLFCR